MLQRSTDDGHRQKRPIGAHSERVFVRAKFLDPLAPKPHQSCARTNEPAELEHALARVLEEKEIRLKNNKLPLSAALHRAIHNSTRQNALAAYLRRFTHCPTCSERFTAQQETKLKEGKPGDVHHVYLRSARTVGIQSA